jgi:hypothetical protein
MNRTEAPTAVVSIYIAGDLDTARTVCREHCLAVGLCVTLEPVEYVYTGGLETGVRVGLINYPRFPTEPAEIMAKAEALALLLIERLHQHSASVVGPETTVWLSRRPPEGIAPTPEKVEEGGSRLSARADQNPNEPNPQAPQ